MTPIRLLIADDHALSREGMRALLGAMPDIEIAGEAADGEAAVAQAIQRAREAGLGQPPPGRH